MKRFLLLVCLTCQAFVGFGQSVLGDWHGALAISGTRLRLIFHIMQEGDALKATMDSPDQKAFGIPVQTVVFADPELTIQMPNIGLTYTGRLAGDSIAGTFSQGMLTAPMGLSRTAKAALTAPARPQEPKPPFPYQSEMVTYPNASAGIRLAGTLTLPKGNGPFPAAVLISGSGAQDRDESLLGHKPFLVIADYLSRHGIAVLRFDDRGVGKSEGNHASATSADFATDVAAGIAYLKSRPEIAPAQIGLIGHSEGGLIAPIVAASDKSVAFLVLLAGPGVPGDDIILLQQKLLGLAAGTPESAIEKGISFNKKAFEVVKKEADNEKVIATLTPLLRPLLQENPGFSDLSATEQEAQVQAQLKTLTSPWFRYFLSFDPSSALRQVKCPVLALNGSKDLQVAPSQNLKPIGDALKKAKNKDVKLVELPGLNHLFQHTETGSSEEYAKIEETFAPEALQQILDWLTPRVMKK